MPVGGEETEMNRTESSTMITHLDVRVQPSEFELQDPALWDWSSARRVRAVKRPRAVVSVAFSREEFERVCAAAAAAGKPVSAYIRKRALR